MHLVSGITGHVGGAAARQLLREGHAVRALVRDPAKAAAWARQGVDVRAGDFGDPAALAAALEGVRGAYLMIPPQLSPASRDFPEARALIASYREALGKAPPPRVVVLSSVGSDQPTGAGLITATHLLEQALRDVPLPVVHIRAGSFLENYAFNLASAAATGRFDTYLMPTDRPVTVIATEDIGREVARRLVGPAWSGTKIVELGSPHSADDLARAMGEALGRPVTAHPIPRDTWRAGWIARGMPPLTAELLEEMSDGFNSGWLAFGVPGAEHVAGSITPTEFFRRLKAASPERAP